MSKKRIMFSVTAATIALFSIVWITLAETSSSARADSASLNTIVEKAQINSLPGCYKNGLVKHLDTSTLGANGENIIANDKIVSTLPGYARGGYKDLLANCRQILFGGNLKDSSLGRFGGLYDIQNTKYKPEDFGYQPTQNSESYGKKCLQATFSLRDRLPDTNQTLDNLLSNIICVPVDSSDHVVSDGLSSQVDIFPASGDHAAAPLGVPTYIGYLDSTDVVGGIPGIYVGSLNSGNSTSSYIDHVVCYSAEGLGPEYSCDITWSTFQNNVKAAFEEGGAVDIRVNEVKVNNLDSSSVASSYELDNTNNKSAEAALRYIKGNNAKIADFAFTPTDWAVLYKNYYDEIAKKYPDKVTVSATECSSNKNQHVYAVTQDGGTTWCKLDIAGVDGVTETFAVRDNDTKLKPGKFSDVITGLMNLDYSQVDKDALINGSDQDPSDGDDEGAGAPCYEAGGALGWIICPVISIAGEAIDGIYQWISSSFLTIKAEFYNRDSGTYTGWAIFRNFANIVFAIMLVIVILAQVTGIGISNYNIKKILPRLVIVIILVNASFLICQLAVDASNLLGYSLYGEFSKLAAGDDFSVGTVIPSVVESLIGGVEIAALGIGAGVVIWRFWLVPFLLLVLSALISIIFFFIIMGVRQAGVIILIVIAPLAIVCYVLPNTKSFFDKWRKIFTALLLVYPICGVLMGGGEFVSRLMLANIKEIGGVEGFVFVLIAMLIQIVPFFFIPSLVRNSMTALGNLGTRINNLGRTWGTAASRGIRNTNAVKEFEAEKARTNMMNRNQRRRDRLSTSGRTGGLYGRFRRAMGWNDHLSNRQQSVLARAQSGLDRASDERAAQLRAVMEQNGMASDITALQQEYDAATEALIENPNDYEALERQKAAASLLLSNGKGRASLLESSKNFVDRVGRMTNAAEASRYMSTMQRSISSLMRTNAGDIAKSPLLSEQFKAMSNLDNMKDIPATSSTPAQTAAQNYAGVNGRALAKSTDSLNIKNFSEMKDKDLDSYVKAITNGDIQYGSNEFDRITSLASRAMTDEHYKGNIEAESMPLMQQLANMRYAPPAAAGATSDQVSQAIAGASSEEIARVQQYLQDTKGNPQFAAERTQLLDNLGHTLGRSLSQAGDSGVSSDDANFNVRAAMAQQIGDALMQNGRKIGDVGANSGYGYNSTTAEDRYDIATGMRADPSSHQTLAQLHPDWEQASTDDLIGNAYKKGDWVRVSTRPGGATTRTKLTPQEIQEAQKLQEQDVEWRINQQKADASAKQRWGR